MNDLIDGRVMLMLMHEELCYDIACRDCSMCTEDGGCRVEEWIDKFQSADAVSVVHGEWIHDGSVWTYRFNCTNCGYHLLGKQTNFCPNCGAKMDGERKESE